MHAARFSLLPLFILLYQLALSTFASAEFKYLHNRASPRLIIFVHGLESDPEETFSSGGSSSSWPMLMATDRESRRASPPLADFAIATLRYPASSRDTLSLPQVADNLSQELERLGVTETHKEIIFIAHSLGGLVVKRMLLSGAIGSRSPLLAATKLVLLIASPAGGSWLAEIAALPVASSIFGGRIVADLARSETSSLLQTIQQDWERLSKAPLADRPWIGCAYETKAYRGILVVVPGGRADQHCDRRIAVNNADHSDIVKPDTRLHDVYKWAAELIAAYPHLQPNQPQQMQDHENPQEVARREIVAAGYSLDNAGFIRAAAETNNVEYLYRDLGIHGDSESLIKALVEYPHDTNENRNLFYFMGRMPHRHYSEAVLTDLRKPLLDLRATPSLDLLWQASCSDLQRNLLERLAVGQLKQYCTDQAQWFERAVDLLGTLSERLRNIQKERFRLERWDIDLTISPAAPVRLAAGQLVDFLSSPPPSKPIIAEGKALISVADISLFFYNASGNEIPQLHAIYRGPLSKTCQSRSDGPFTRIVAPTCSATVTVHRSTRGQVTVLSLSDTRLLSSKKR